MTISKAASSRKESKFEEQSCLTLAIVIRIAGFSRSMDLIMFRSCLLFYSLQLESSAGDWSTGTETLFAPSGTLSTTRPKVVKRGHICILWLLFPISKSICIPSWFLMIAAVEEASLFPAWERLSSLTRLTLYCVSKMKSGRYNRMTE